MGNLTIDEKSKATLSLPLRVWIGGIVAFGTLLTTTVGTGLAGWYQIQQQFAELRTTVVTGDDLDNFGDKLLTRLPTIQAVAVAESKIESTKMELERLERRIERLEARP